MRPKWKAHCAVNFVHFIDGRKNRAFVVNGFLYFNVTRRSNSMEKFKKNIILFIQLFPVLWQGTKLYIEQVLHHVYWTSSVSSVLLFLLSYQSKLASCTPRLKCQRGRTRNSGLYIDHRSRHRHGNWDSYCISQHSLHLGVLWLTQGTWPCEISPGGWREERKNGCLSFSLFPSHHPMRAFLFPSPYSPCDTKRPLQERKKKPHWTPRYYFTLVNKRGKQYWNIL